MSADEYDLLADLGVRADVFRVQWSRTADLGAAGYVTLSFDLDVRRLTLDERELLRALIETFNQLGGSVRTFHRPAAIPPDLQDERYPISGGPTHDRHHR